MALNLFDSPWTTHLDRSYEYLASSYSAIESLDRSRAILPVRLGLERVVPNFTSRLCKIAERYKGRHMQQGLFEVSVTKRTFSSIWLHDLN
ncbi:hypothetical protein AFLA_013224 [Aspergillus flavus NRRL3357]|nr:hypothetical protein AFLA_013224 [Aspergillus flavus NRRL3357]